jgi:opacity protein-like surface antigen
MRTAFTLGPPALASALSLSFSLALAVPSASAADLSYTFIDFRVVGSNFDGSGEQNPIPEQSVRTEADGGSGISVAGSLALPAGLYATGLYDSSILDVTTTVTSPLATADIADQFDLTSSRFGIGYRHALGAKLDVIAELTYDTAELDFGSLAGEDFDTKGSGATLRAGFRWAPSESFEVYASGGRSPVGRVSLDDRRFESGAVVNAGMRWYFFQDLGVGLDYQSGDLSALTLSMRFGFGDLPW